MDATGDDDEPLSYSQAKRQVGLSHVRQARSAIDDARTRPPAVKAKPKPVPRSEPPTLPLVEPAGPEPIIELSEPEPPPAGTVAEPALADASGVSEQLAQLVAAVDMLSNRLERDLGENDALTARYEMELAAHRDTVEQLLERQDAHIQTLNRLVEQLINERDRSV